VSLALAGPGFANAAEGRLVVNGTIHDNPQGRYDSDQWPLGVDNPTDQPSSSTAVPARGPLFRSESRRNAGQPLTLWSRSKVVRRIALAA